MVLVKDRKHNKAAGKYGLFKIGGYWYVTAPFDAPSDTFPYVGRARELQDAIDMLQFDNKWRTGL